MKRMFRRPSIAMFALFVTISLLFSINALSPTKALESKKTIGVLISSDFRLPKVEGLKDSLIEYQYIEGKTVDYIIKNAKGKKELLPSLAEDLLKEQPDVIFVTGESEALAAQAAVQATMIPIVFVGVDSAQKIGLVESNALPGKNITGVENRYLLLSGKRLEYFQRLLPKVKNIAVFYDSRVTLAQSTLPFLNDVSAKLNLSLQAIPVDSYEEALQAVNSLNPQTVDGAMFLCSELLESITQEVSAVALEKHIPIMGVSEEQTEKGLLASYGMPYYEQGLQASRLVAKVLRGEDPSLIPVESPAEVEFIVNPETSKKLGLTLDPAGLTCVTKFLGEGAHEDF